MKNVVIAIGCNDQHCIAIVNKIIRMVGRLEVPQYS